MFGDYNFKREFQVFKKIVMEMAAARIFDTVSDSPRYHVILENLKNRQVDPYSAAEQLADRLDCRVSV